MHVGAKGLKKLKPRPWPEKKKRKDKRVARAIWKKTGNLAKEMNKAIGRGTNNFVNKGKKVRMTNNSGGGKMQRKS